MKKINANLKVLVLLATMVVGANNVWGLRYAKVVVYSSPQEGGYVDATRGEPSPSNLTSDESKDDNAKISDYTFTFNIGAKPKNGYVFKGWTTSSSNNSGNMSNPSSVGVKATSANNTAFNYATATYYAIFARMVLASGSTTRNLSTTLKSSVTDEVTINHVHAGTVSASMSGDGYSVALKKNDTQISTSSEVSTTFIVTYNPQVAGLNQVGKLTISSDNGLTNIVVQYSGTSNKFPQSITWDETKVDCNISKESQPRDISDYVSIVSEKSPKILSFTSDATDIIEIEDNVKIKPLKAGSANITAHLAGDGEYEAASSTAKTFEVSERSTPKYTVNTIYNLLVGESFTVTSTSPLDISCERVSGSADGIYSYDNGKVTALKEGTVVLKFKQSTSDAWYPGETGNVTVNISRYTTNLSVNTSAHTLLVGETYDPAFTTNNSEVTPSFTSSNPSVAIYEDGVIKALAAGSATLTFEQNATNKWTGASQTINVTVNKHNPNLHATNIPATNWNTIITPVFATENMASEILLSQLDGEASAKLIDGNIVVYNVEGTAHFRATQEATDYYTAAQYDFDVVVAHANTHVAFTLTTANHASFDAGRLSKGAKWNSNAYTLGDGGWTTQDDYVIISFTGVPDKVSFDKSLNESFGQLPGTYLCQVFESATGADDTWTKAWEHNKREASTPGQSVQLKPETQYLKFLYHGTVYANYSNIHVSERSEVLADNYDFGTFDVGATATARAIPMKWYNVPALTITSSNPAVFEVTTPTIAAGIDVFDENASIGITYHHNVVSPAAGDEATITIVSANGAINRTFKVTGRTIKKTQTIVWEDGISPMTVGKTHDDPASAALPLNYEVISGSAVEVLDGNRIHAIAAGEATVRAYNDGDDTWNAVSGTFDFTVTELKVQRIHWAQTFSRLRTTSDDITLNAEVFVVKEETEEKVDHPITYTSSNTSVVTIINGNTLHVVGAGTATVTAHVDGDAEYTEDNLSRAITVREPSEGCEMFVLENASDKLFTIDSKELTLSGEPKAITFDAWSSRWGLVSPSSSPMKLAEYYDGAWHEIWQNELKVDQQQSFGPIALHRNATKIKFYTEVGATCYHSFSSAYVTLAQYLEFTDAPDATAYNVYFPAAETQIGQTYTKTVNIRYSDIFDQLSITHTNSKFTITPTVIGIECGDHGTAAISIRFRAEAEGSENDVITITDGRKKLTIRVSATTRKNDQTITFAPAESILTTDNITLSATASSGLSVTLTQMTGLDYATVNAAGEVTILQGGGAIVVRATQVGSSLYNAAPSVDKTIYINKVTPTIATLPTVAAVTLPATLADATIDGASAVVNNDKGVAVAGTFTWTNEATAVVAGTQTYPAVFTPANTNYYNATTCSVPVTADKRTQTISWSLADNSEFHYFRSVALDAEASSALAVSYTSSDESVAKIVAGAVQFVAPGTVTLTATQAGNETYEAAPAQVRTISIVKATPVISTTPSLVTFYQGHSLSESPILGGVATVDGHVVEGTFSWKKDATPAVGDDYTFPAIFTPNNTTFFAPVECMVPVRVTVYDRIFTDETGNHLWSDPLNWANGFVPESLSDATIDGPVIINTNVTIDQLTIEESASVLVVENGSLTIGHSGESANGLYGDLYVKDAASVTFNGNFEVGNVYLSAVLSSVNAESRSAQIINAANLHVDGDVYFDVMLDASGACSPGWYDFTVPFPVDVMNGVYRMQNGVQTKLVNERNYAIMSYDEAVRARGQYGWKKFRGVMQPGICYSITVDNVYPVYRFKKTATGAFNTSATMPLTYTEGEGGAEHQGWNCLGNGTLCHADLLAQGVNKVQVYNHATNSYTPVEIDQCSFVVGAAFFVQATPESGKIVYSQATSPVLRAPSRAATSQEHRLTITRDGDEKANDCLYLSASTDACYSYQPGRDLAKFEVSSSVAQMWCSAYGSRLCDVELPLMGNGADFPLTFSVPTAGTYLLENAQPVEGETLYLVENGRVIWNLSMSEYELDLNKGTNTSYAVRLVRNAPSVTTDIDDAMLAPAADKFIYDGALYILRDGRLYDAQGHLIQ